MDTERLPLIWLAANVLYEIFERIVMSPFGASEKRALEKGKLDV